jgi:hypothetical protein
MCVGQALDQICLQLALQLVKDQKDVEATRIKARVELLNGDFVTLSPAVKLLEI